LAFCHFAKILSRKVVSVPDNQEPDYHPAFSSLLPVKIAVEMLISGVRQLRIYAAIRRVVNTLLERFINARTLLSGSVFWRSPLAKEMVLETGY
jgi:hypothetical protein